jgi:5-formyltetrahydrofolate cyclo-ligase
MSSFPLPQRSQNLPIMKNELRQFMRREREALIGDLRVQAQSQISSFLLQHPKIQKAKCLAAYAAFDGEVDLSEFYQRWLSEKKHRTIVFPIHYKNQPLSFHYPHAWGTHHSASYAIPIGPKVSSNEIEVMLVPGIAFGEKGQRLGLGGGYYDRTLHVLQQKAWSGSVFGVAFLLQSVQHLPQEEWDYSVSALVNETGCYHF